MNFKVDLNDLLSRESEQVEWKEHVADPGDVARTIVAFANDFSNLGGGYVVCGAKEEKDPHGFARVAMTGLTASEVKRLEGKILELCRSDISPPITPLLEEIPVSEERKILVFLIPSSKQAHSFRQKTDTGKYYIRRGKATEEARNGLLRELLSKKDVIEPWDRRYHPSAVVEDIDLLAFRELLQQLGCWDHRRNIDEYLSPSYQISPLLPSFCIREPLTNQLRPRNFTLLLVARNVSKFYPEAHTIFSLYTGTEISEPFAERKEVCGTLLSQASNLLELLNTEAFHLFKKSDDLPNVVKYPKRALHEALINALAHRDYEQHHPIRIRVFFDRIEIFSPGGLVKGVSREKFLDGAAFPVWRNQALSWILIKLRYAQAEGQGIATIFRTMKEEGCPEPSFEISDENIVCRLPAHPRHQTVKALQEVQSLVSLGRFTEADHRITELLQADPHNVRTLSLFCEIQRSLQGYRRIYEFIQAQRSSLPSFPSAVQLLLADALLDYSQGEQSQDHRDAKGLAMHLFSLASRNASEENEMRRIAVGFLRLKEEQKALDYLLSLARSQPSWVKHPSFLQLKGDVFLGFAKRCIHTARSGRLSPKLKASAWDDCRRYLAEADALFQEALRSNPDSFIQGLLEKNVSFLQDLKIQAKKPRRPPHRS